MSNFLNILLLLASAYASFMFFNKARSSIDDLYIIYGIASVLLFVTFLATPINLISGNFNFVFPYDAYVDWGRIVSISALMSSLIELIRKSKPEFARFPRFFVGLPILLVATYPLIMNTIVLKEWLIATYEGGCLIVAFLMHLMHMRKQKEHVYILSGLTVLLLTYIIYWFSKGYLYDYDWFWQTGLLISFLVIITGFNKLETTGRKLALNNSTEL